MKVLNTVKWMILIGISVIFLSSCEEKQEYVAVTGIEILPKDTTIGLNETVSIRINVYPENATNKGYSVQASNPEVISMIGAVVTGTKAGSATITVISEDGGKTATAKIKVKEPEKVIEPVVLALDTVSVTHSEIVVRVSAPDTARYWIWCEERTKVGHLNEDEFMNYDQNLIDQFRSMAEEEAGKHLPIEDVIEAISYVGGQDLSMSARMLTDIYPETEYVIWAYGIDERGRRMENSEIYSILVKTHAEPNDDGPDDEPNDDKKPEEGFEEFTITNSDFTIVVKDATSSAIIMEVTPTVSSTPYFAYYLKSSELKPGGWFAGLTDGLLVAELFFDEVIYDELFKNQYTGIQTVEFTKNIKAETEYTILLFRGIGTLDGKLTKFTVTTLAE